MGVNGIDKGEALSEYFEDEEILTGDNCPICGYPIVLEHGLEVCYSCGWSGDMK